jgi:DNA polymerase-1
MTSRRDKAPGRPLLVIDGDSLAHRAFHALPKSIKDGSGRPANMIVGFANMLSTLWSAEQPRTVLVGFDTLTNSTYRNELFPGYQSGREFPLELVEQLDRLPELVSSFGFAAAKEAGYEADDFLAAASRAETERGGQTLVVTSDRDSFQLASDSVTILLPKRGVHELERVGPAEVRERYGVEPSQVPDFIALRGDPSDRIPGASGVGPAKAAVVLREHGTLDAALEAGRFASQADELRLYQRLARLQYDAPIPDLPNTEPDWAGAAALAGRWGLKALAGRLAERAG